MPYINPDIVPLPEATNYRGFCVYVPDLPEYRAALLGSINFLGTWAAWQRDSEQTAKKSAELWKIANALTRLSWDNDCSEDCMAFDCEAMKDCLIEVARAISVNVTVNNSCGGTSGGGTLYCVNEDGDIIVNPPPVVDTPSEPGLPLPPDMTAPPVFEPEIGTPPDGYETWEAYNIAACRAANSVWQWAMNALLFIRELLTERVYQITTVFALIVNFMTGGIGLIFSSAMMLKIAELYAKLYTWLDPLVEAVDSAIDDLETNKQEYICWMYEHRGNAGEWELDLIEKLFTASSSGLLANTQQPLWKDLLSFLIAPYTAINALYGGLTYDGDDTNFLDCDVCAPQARWVLVPVNASNTTDGATALQVSGNNITWYANNKSVDLDIYSTGLPLEQGQSLVGLSLTTNNITGQYYTGKTTGGTWAFGADGQTVFIIPWHLSQTPEFVTWSSGLASQLLDQPDSFWQGHTKTDVNSWSTGANDITLNWILENASV